MKSNDTPAAAEDAALLFPDVDVTVRDPDSGEPVTLTVREFRFLEGLQIHAEVRPLIEAIAGSAEGDDVDEHRIATALTDHADIWVRAIARATGREAEWIGRLSDHDGQALSAAMWGANGSFFVRRLVEAVTRRRQANRPSPSPKSSTPSSGPDTDADTGTSRSG